MDAKTMGLMPLVVLLAVAGCKNQDQQAATSSAPTVVQAAPVSRAKVEADFASAPYSPVGEGNASVLVEQYNFNHNNTGRQGVLVQTQINHLQADDGQLSGHHYFIYSPKIHNSDDESTKCDLREMLTDSHGQTFKFLMFGVAGEGFINSSTINRENENVIGLYPGRGCDFVITGVHSLGTIPEDVWDRADALWQQEEAKVLAERAKAKEPLQTKATAPVQTDESESEPDTNAETDLSGQDSESEQSVTDAVNAWVRAFRARDSLALAECYAPRVEKYFRRDNVGRDQVQGYFRDAFARMVDLRRYEVKDIQVNALPADDTSSEDSVVYSRATATFNKTWDETQSDGKTFSGEEIEQLTLASSPEGWKIVREEELKILRVSKR